MVARAHRAQRQAEASSGAGRRRSRSEQTGTAPARSGRSCQPLAHADDQAARLYNAPADVARTVDNLHPPVATCGRAVSVAVWLRPAKLISVDAADEHL